VSSNNSYIACRPNSCQVYDSRSRSSEGAIGPGRVGAKGVIASKLPERLSFWPQETECGAPRAPGVDAGGLSPGPPAQGVKSNTGTTIFERKPHNLEYLDLIFSFFGMTEYERVSACNYGQSYWSGYCDDCGKLKVVMDDVCDTWACPDCQGRYRKQKAQRAFERMRYWGARDKKGFYYPAFVFTLPDTKWGELFGSREKCNKFFRAVYGALHKFYGGQVGGLASLHTWKDNMDIDVHIDVVMSGLLLFEDEFRQVTRYLGRDDLAMLKTIYRAELVRVFGWQDLPPVLDVQVNYRRGDRALHHRINYSMRAPVESYVGMEGMGPGQLLHVLKHFNFRRGYKASRWFGFLSDSTYKKACELRGLSPKVWREYVPRDVCAYCGGKITWGERVIDGKVVFRRAPPEPVPT